MVNLLQLRIVAWPFRLPVLCLLFHLSLASAKAQSIAGFVRDAKTGEALPGVSIKTTHEKPIGFTNQQGYFSVQAEGRLLTFSMIGYAPTDTLLTVQDKPHQILLNFTTQNLQEVSVVGSSRDDFYNNVIKLTAREISTYPSIMGEKDLIKVIQTLPGVKSIVEGGSGFSVRGGGPDQNLVLLDGVPLYSYNHLFGLFSMFNTDVVKDVELSKDAISARYGGRASSVLNITMKDGNPARWHGKASIGLLSSKVALDGPLIKDKLTAVASVRRSYLDLLTRPFMPQNNRQLYTLSDVFAKLNYTLGTHDQLVAGYYSSKDLYSENYKKTLSGGNSVDYPFGFGWKNRVSYLRYSHAKDNFSLNAGIYQTRYDFFYDESVIRTEDKAKIPLSNLQYDASIRDLGVNLEAQKYFKRFTLFFGGGLLSRQLQPQTIVQENTRSGGVITNESSVQKKTSQEGYFFAEGQGKLAENMTLNAGLRYVFWKDKEVRFYPEPRLSATVDLPWFSVKPAYFRINQFVHLLSNTGGTLPNDVWITANDYARPVANDQFSLSAMRSFTHRGQTLYVELGTYVKKMKHVVDYNNGQNLFSMVDAVSQDTENLSDVISVGRGLSRGVEALVRYTTPKLNALLSYTLSRTFYTFETINFGERYYPGFDRLQDLSINTSYKPSDRFTVSLSVVAASANPVTIPLGVYSGLQLVNNKTIAGTSEQAYVNYRNNYRLEPYYCFDLGLAFKKQKRWFERTWEVSVFNATARKNPFYYTLTQELISLQERTVRYTPQKRVFLTIVPSVSYLITF